MESSKKSFSATISPQERLASLILVKGQHIRYMPLADVKPVQFATFESPPATFDSTPITTSAIDQQSQPLSEDDTASSTFSSQEECYVSLPPPDSSKGNGKIRKRRKHRASLPLLENLSKKRSSASEDLNIEGVGDALAEINLSFISASADSKQEAQGGMGKTVISSTSTSLEDGIGDNQLLLGPPVELKSKPNRFIKRSLPKDEEEIIVASLDSFSLKKDNLGQHGFEQELLMSIQAVSIGPSQSTTQLPPPPSPTVIPESESLSRNPFMTVAEDESLVSSQLHDLYAELVNGGASLSLEDSSATIFDSQLLIDALQSVAEDLEAGTSIDQLTRDLSDSFLEGTLSPLDVIGVSDLVPFTSTAALPDFTNKSTLLTDIPLIEPGDTNNATNGGDRLEAGKCRNNKRRSQCCQTL